MDLLNSSHDDDEGLLQVREQVDAFTAAESSVILPTLGLIEDRKSGMVVGDGDNNDRCNQEGTLDSELYDEVVHLLLRLLVDEFGLDLLRFIEEQKSTPMMANILFLKSDALLIDSQLRVRILQKAPHYEMPIGASGEYI
ncbi:hypothetical protein PC128_g6736 [Phytophthora cactorum]|nr:hypothetical protein PC128_g6736 [Phytophthora cactorum]